MVSYKVSSDHVSDRSSEGRLVKQMLLVKAATLHQASFVPMHGTLLPRVPMGRRLCKKEWSSKIIYSIIIRINTK